MSVKLISETYRKRKKARNISGSTSGILKKTKGTWSVLSEYGCLTLKGIIPVYIFYQYYPGLSYVENHMSNYFDKATLISPKFDYLGLPQEVAINLFNTQIKFPQASQQVLQLQ